MGKLRNQSILLLGFLTPFYTTFIRSFQRNKSLPEFVKFASQVKYACGVGNTCGRPVVLGCTFGGSFLAFISVWSFFGR